MQRDPQINAERQAVRKNRKLEQRYRLLHRAGIVDQGAACWTTAHHLTLQAACRAGYWPAWRADQLVPVRCEQGVAPTYP